MRQQSGPTDGVEPHLAGLRRRVLAPVDVTAQSVSATAPTFSMAGAPATVAVATGGAVLQAFVVSMALIALVGFCINQFTRRVASTGSLYTFVAMTFGVRVGAVTAYVLLIGYSCISAAALLLCGAYLGDEAGRLGLAPAGMHIGGNIAVVLAVGFVAGACLIRGIGASTRVTLGIEVVAVLGMGLVLVLVLSGTGLPSAAQLFTPVAGLRGTLLGVTMAMTCFVGFESAAALGVETYRPYRNVPRAITITITVTGLLYLFSAYAQSVGLPSVAPTSQARDLAVTSLAVQAHFGWAAHLVAVVVAASAFCCVLSTTTVQVRLLFTLSREHLLPRWLGAVTGAGTPRNAIALATSALLVISIVGIVAHGSHWEAAEDLAMIGTFGYMAVYIATCCAAPVFLRRLGELTWPPLVAGLVATTGMICAFVAFAVSPDPTMAHVLPTVLVSFVVLGIGVAAVADRRARRHHYRTGVRDTVRADELYRPADLDQAA